MSQNLNSNSNNTFKDHLQNNISSQFSFKKVTTKEIENIIKELQSKNSTGHDDISCNLLKYLLPVLSQSLTLIINQSLNTGIFPNKLKLAKLVPIFKKGDTSFPENYRPISLLPAISKVFEKVVFNQLYEYFISNKLLNNNQYGFRKLHSTEHAVLHFVDRIITELDKSNSPIAIFLDLSKAFDTLNYDILIQKLKYYGIADISLTWFKSYILNRNQFVTFKHCKSETLETQTGVPQGSILGPLLFIIYTNDIVNVSNYFEPIIYADDTSLINTSLNLNKTEDIATLNNEFNKIYQWLTINKLTLNISKTKYMIFTSKNRTPVTCSLKVNNIQIEKVSEFSFLGITLNDNLTWHNHINKIANKISRNIGLLYKLKHFLPPFVLRTLYCSLILAHLNYGNLIWGTNTARILKLQKKAIRVISNCKYNAHTEPLFKSLKLLHITDIYKLNSLKFYYKYIQGTLPSYFYSFNLKHVSDVHNYNTRSREKLCYNHTFHKFADNCLKTQLPIIINNTESIVLEKLYTHSYDGFLSYFKHYCIENYKTVCHIENCYVCQANLKLLTTLEQEY